MRFAVADWVFRFTIVFSLLSLLTGVERIRNRYLLGPVIIHQKFILIRVATLGYEPALERDDQWIDIERVRRDRGADFVLMVKVRTASSCWVG